MKTTILFFGRLSDQFGRERDVDVPETGCTVGELKAQLASSEPAFGAFLANEALLAAVDQVMAADDDRIRSGQEVALF